MTTMKLTTKDITQISLFTALTAIGAFISIPVGPVPITLQSLFVIISGIVLGSKKAFYSQIAYMLLGLAGLPIFSNFTGGLQAVLKPSFGFLIGYVIVAYFMGRMTETGGHSAKNLIVSVFTGTLALYAIGIPYMYFILNIFLAKNFSMIQILNMGMFLFIPGDAIKAILAVYLGKILKGRSL